MRASDLVWHAQTIDRLFEVGPETLGSTMPRQRMPHARDRALPIAYLWQVTATD